MIKKEDIKTRIIWTAEEFQEATKDWGNLIVADVETYRTDPKDGKLLGVALCDVSKPLEPIYVVENYYTFATSSWNWNPSEELMLDIVAGFLENKQLVGHNYSYDKNWLDHSYTVNSQWKACTRLMWHMASAPLGPRGYGLKDAQVEVLGWEKKGDIELVEQVEARGGSLKNGDHYLADVDTLGKYACLDAASTALLYTELSAFFDRYDYWWMLDKMVHYSWLLQECTEAGIRVDTDGLEAYIQVLEDTKGAYGSRFIELAASHINKLERFWREDRAAKYILPEARERFLGSWDLQKKFNLSSDKDKRELFYNALALPVVKETDGGKPSTGIDALRLAVRESGRQAQLAGLMEAYEECEAASTLLDSFAKPWSLAVKNGRLHPRFNPCGTVSYRLSGFKPYLLNAPFSELELMSHLKCDEGWVGIHADFASVEPCVTAHYSQDPSLLKVFRDGRGDVYLDLGLTLFPGDLELKDGYNPHLAPTAEVKKRFKKQRDIAKIIQLAVQYTGTKFTVHRNLNEYGYPCTLADADALVTAYWKHFRRVAIMNEALHLKHASWGFLRNVVGRVIRAPFPRYKDTPNRFIQSSGHDLLSFYVIIIDRMCREQGIPNKPVIIDCHDSTDRQCPLEYADRMEKVFLDALTELNETVKMSVPVRIEMKRFTTLAGLKGDE